MVDGHPGPPALPGPWPDRAALAALADKYRTLAALRARRDALGDAGDPAPDRASLRALAAVHPGCLRELDVLGATEIGRRAEATRAAVAGLIPGEPWMAWVWGYHQLMSAALAVKRALGALPAGLGEPGAVERLVALATQRAGIPVDAAFVCAVAAPPERRLGPVVLRALGALFATPPATIAGTLFPVRRPSPYGLSSD